MTPDATFAPIRAQFGPPALDWVGPHLPPGAQEHVRCALSRGRPVVLEGRLRQRDPRRGRRSSMSSTPQQLPTGKSTMHLYPIDGAAGRVPKDATAWNYRDAKWGMVMVGVSPDPADNAQHDRLDPGLLGGAASLFGRRRLRQHDDGCHRRGPGPGARRLRRALRPAGPDQAKYDPANLFRVNQNITPA